MTTALKAAPGQEVQLTAYGAQSCYPPPALIGLCSYTTVRLARTNPCDTPARNRLTVATRSLPACQRR